jgi:phosphatidylglycerol lysyltransferase
MRPRRRTRITLCVVAGLTALVGIVNLVAAVTPIPPERLAWARDLYPFEIRAGAHVFSALTGFGLLTLAHHLLRRKRVAWLLAVILLTTSMVSHLVRGLDGEAAALSAVLPGQLVWMHGLFTAQSDRPSMAQGLRVLLWALLFTLAYGTLGFYFLDHHYAAPFSLKGALAQTLAMFFTEANADLRPTTRIGSYFANSIYFVGLSTLSYAFWMLWRPVMVRSW